MPKTFEEAWAQKELEGYQYGGDALENVRFGWDIAMGEIRKANLILESHIREAGIDLDLLIILATASYESPLILARDQVRKAKLLEKHGLVEFDPTSKVRIRRTDEGERVLRLVSYPTKRKAGV